MFRHRQYSLLQRTMSYYFIIVQAVNDVNVTA